MKFFILITILIFSMGCSRNDKVSLSQEEKAMIKKLSQINVENQKKINELQQKLNLMSEDLNYNKELLQGLGLKIKFDPIDVSKLKFVEDQPNGVAPKDL
jgi:hypothetical protein